MSDKKNKVKKVDCSKSCKMSRQLRDSDFCNKEAKIVEGSVFFGCRELLKKEPKEVRQFYACDLWNMGLEDSCNSCELICKNNKSENVQKAIKQDKELEKLIKDLTPHMVLKGVTPQEVKKISSTYTKKNSSGKTDPMGAEAINAAKFANDALAMAVSGKRIDLAFYSLFARRANAKIKKARKKKK